MNRQDVDNWMGRLKSAWEGGDEKSAVALFAATERYFERPFKPGTTQEEIQTYWKDIRDLSDITLDYEVVAVEGSNACVHWKNSFRTSPGGELSRLDGMFWISFNADGQCREFRQWWFAEPKG